MEKPPSSRARSKFTSTAMCQHFVVFFTAPKRSKGVLRYIYEIITYTAASGDSPKNVLTVIITSFSSSSSHQEIRN